MERAQRLYGSDPTFRRLAKVHLSYLVMSDPGQDYNYAAKALLLALDDREQEIRNMAAWHLENGSAEPL
jgi:hypothetical protein